ncbi:MAG TPA: choice-of-anchor tandem repeat GloVer-containing protein [Candidatus Methylacidiphilales bacterium]|nr:choice-of-anchor tandem repeat GloVer-containing protein [Candidatus Methylacidiphilales bacterium]
MNVIVQKVNDWAILALLASVLPIQNLCAEETVETLATFTGPNGAYPGYILQDHHGNFYGTTYTGGKFDKGTIFELPLNKPLQTIISFDGSNGANPISGLLEGPDGNFYGTTNSGGPDGKGIIFRLTTDGKLTTLVAFNGPNGAYPKSPLMLGRDGNFYGTAFSGGPTDKGLIFCVTPQGKLTPLVTFNGSNGTNPGVLSRGRDGCFYGTTYKGGEKDLGTAFKYDPDPQFTTLVSFNGDNGANPQAQMSQLSDGDFYGTTYAGGKNQKGTIFSVTPDGKLTTRYAFNGSDGANPNSGLVQWSDGYFYIERIWENQWIKASTIQWNGVNFCGTTSAGGQHGNGTVFRVTSDGSLTTLVSFTGTSGKRLGTIPNSLIPGNDGNLYGTTYYGGRNNKGTVFRLLLQVWPPASAGRNATAAFSPQVQAVVSP